MEKLNLLKTTPSNIRPARPQCSFSFDTLHNLPSFTNTPTNQVKNTMSPSSQCKVCKRFFKGRRGLNIHLGRNPNCKRNVSVLKTTISNSDANLNVPHGPNANNDNSDINLTIPQQVQNTIKSPSTSIESLECMCGNGLGTKIKKHNSKHGCKLCCNLSTKDHFVSSSTHRIYEALIPPDIFSLDCNSSNVIYLITCKKCYLQYVGETAQKLRERCTHHRSCMNYPEKDNNCRILSDHFSKGACRNAKFSVHIIEKLPGDGRDEDGNVDSAMTTIRRKKETAWMLKLRTVFPYGLNDRVGDEYMSEKGNCNVASKFPTLKRNGNRFRVRTKTYASSNFICEHFIYILNESFRNNIKNSMNLVRVLLSSLSKSACKSLYGKVMEFLADKHDSFMYGQYFLAALDILSSRIGKAPCVQKATEKPTPSNRCHITFDNKAIDFINIQRIFRDNEVVDQLPKDLKTDIPMVVYRLTDTIRSKLFNYKNFVQSLDVDSFLADNTLLPCQCQNSPFLNSDHNHIITGDLNIISNHKLRGLFAKGPKFREPVQFSYQKAKSAILKGVQDCIKSWSNRTSTPLDAFRDWEEKVKQKIEERISLLRNRNKQHYTQSVLKNVNVKNCLEDLQDKYVIVPIDKASNNVAFICKRFYATVLLKELGLMGQSNTTYTQVHDGDIESVVSTHCTELKNKFNITVSNGMRSLPDIYWTPKLHKTPVKFRFIIASKYCTTKSLSKDLSSIFSLFNRQIETYNKKAHYYSGVKSYWIISNRNPVLNNVQKSVTRKSAKCVSSFDFSTLYTKIPHDKLIDVLQTIIEFVFKGGSKKCIAINRCGKAYWAEKGNKSRQNCFNKDSIIDAVIYLVSNCYFKLGDKLFRQEIGIPMGSDPSPFFANLFLYHYESSWLKNVKKSNNILARKFGSVFRYIDDLLALNDGHAFESFHHEIYPEELELTKENDSVSETNFLDLNIKIENGSFNTKLYDKRNDFGFDITRFPYKSSNIPCRMFYASVAAEALRICRATSKQEQVVVSIKSLFSRMYKQGAEKSKMRKALSKIFNKNQVADKYNVTTESLLDNLFN